MNNRVLQIRHQLQQYGTATYTEDRIIPFSEDVAFYAELPAYHVWGDVVLNGYIEHGLPYGFQAVRITHIVGSNEHLVEFGTIDT